jgi:hypothetical protein
MKRILAVAVLAGTVLTGCAVVPAYEPVAYGPPAAYGYGPAPVVVAPAPAVVVRPAFYGSLSYYHGPRHGWHGGWH